MNYAFVMCAQNSYLDPSGSMYMGERSDILKVRTVDWLKDCRDKKLFFRLSRSTQDNFFRGERTYSIATTGDFQIQKDINRYAGTIFDIYRYSAFHMTTLEGFIKREGIQSVTLMGIETCTTVLFTAEELRNRGLEVSVVEPCCLSVNEGLHGSSIELMRRMGVNIIV